jgi:hypothetical protein
VTRYTGRDAQAYLARRQAAHDDTTRRHLTPKGPPTGPTKSDIPTQSPQPKPDIAPQTPQGGTPKRPAT